MTGTVTIGCKMPSGVILNLDKYEQVAKGETPARISGETTVTLKGNARFRNSEKLDLNPRLVGGYAFTEIDAEFWDEWVKTHKDSPLLKDGLIFAKPAAVDAEAKAKNDAKKPAMFPPAPREDGAVKAADKAA